MESLFVGFVQFLILPVSYFCSIILKIKTMARKILVLSTRGKNWKTGSAKKLPQMNMPIRAGQKKKTLRVTGKDIIGLAEVFAHRSIGRSKGIAQEQYKKSFAP